MRLQRVSWDGTDPQAQADRIRSTAEQPTGLADDVARIIQDVRERGDEAVLELTRRFDATERMPENLRVDDAALDNALDSIDSGLRESLEAAASNIRRVAQVEMQDSPVDLTLPEGHRVSVVASAVSAAGVYAPGGRAAYPSSVLMAAVPAVVAGVARVVLASPPGPDGEVSDVVLAAARIAGVSEVHAMGGAQAIAALSIGTESVERVDVVTGPGNAWVTEAKRQLYGKVGIDGLAGPSELIVIADGGADAREIALDVLAQAEHGADSPVVVISSDSEILDEIERQVEELRASRDSVADAPLTLVECDSIEAALDLSDAFAPEHLELRFDGGDSRAADRIAGCVFVGTAGATAFGDYAAGSNHVLPTGGAARFGGPLGVGSYLRRTSIVDLPEEAAAALATTVDTIARAEGLPVHGESAMARTQRRSG